jgi:hypothetical protein
MFKIPKIDNKKIEERSKIAQEKFADQCMNVSAGFVVLGFGGMFSLLGNLPKYQSFSEFFSATLVFLVCLIFAVFIRKEAYEIYDRLSHDDINASKNTSKTEKTV